MSVKNLLLLEESIQHWTKLLNFKSVAEFEAEGWGTSSCALCHEYLEVADVANDESCGECPIAVYSGEDGCLSTPYSSASDTIHQFTLGKGLVNYAKIQREVTFLRQVLIIEDLKEVTPLGHETLQNLGELK